jgi:hypothetical protein
MPSPASSLAVRNAVTSTYSSLAIDVGVSHIQSCVAQQPEHGPSIELSWALLCRQRFYFYGLCKLPEFFQGIRWRCMRSHSLGVGKVSDAPAMNPIVSWSLYK